MASLDGISLHEQGRVAEAEASFRSALAADPTLVDVMNNLANLLRESGRLEEAEALLRQALELAPGLAKAHLNLGNVLRMRGRLEEAERSCWRALSLNPRFAEAYVGFALVLQALGRLPNAEQALREALLLRPGHLDTQVRLGNLLWEAGRWPEAEQQFLAAISAHAITAPAHNNVGIAFSALGRIEDAEESYRRALAIEPGFSDAQGNLGNALRDQGRLEEAGACFREALRLAPAEAGAHLNAAIHYLLCGDYAAGWPEYEWRWRDRSLRPDRRAFAQPLWTGKEDLRGKTILLHAEQGLGDTVQFARYAPLVAQKGARVMLEVQPLLAPALAGMEGVEQVIAAGDALPAAEFHCPLMSLPLAMGTDSLTKIPSPGGYLSPASLPAGGERLVGLCWRGNPRNRIDRSRSARLADFLPLLAIPGVKFVSLQQLLDAEEYALVAGHANFVHEDMAFKDKAALVGTLDLVISVDTVWAHWAGAIGKPLWAALSFVPAWCWLLDRADSPWYASARLFRQRSRGDWAGVVADLCEALPP